MKPEQKQLARDLYLQTDKTQQEIAEILDVNRRTVYLWIKNGKWEEMRIAAAQAPSIMVQNFQNYLSAINERITEREPGDRVPTMHEVEMMRKLLNMIGSLTKKAGSTYLEVFSEFMHYIVGMEPAQAKPISKLADNFLRGKVGDTKFYLDQRVRNNARGVIEYLKKNPEPPEEEAPGNAPGPAPDGKPAEPVEPAKPGGPAEPTEANTPLSAPVTIGSEDRDEVAPAGDSCDKNGTFLGHSCVPGQQHPDTPEPNTGAGNNGSGPDAKYPISDFSAGGTIPAPQPTPLTPCLCKKFFDATKCSCRLPGLMKLPLAQRPSPCRDGNIIWVAHIDDVEKRLDNFGNPWGELKMADAIRHYPDADVRLR